MTLVRLCGLPGVYHEELAADSYACPSCQEQLQRQLHDIGNYLKIVSVMPSRSGEFTRHAPGFRSAPPLRLDVVAMLDPRTELNGDGPDDIVDEVPNVYADLEGWWQIVADGLGLAPAIAPRYRPEPQVWVWNLNSRISWICRQDWVDEFASSIGRLHGAMARACGDVPPKAWGRCLDQACNGSVFRRSEDPRDARLQCRTCRTTYDGLDLIRIGSAS
jgi:hypothetical protein